MKKQISVLILMGPPGCGKGTQGDHIAKKFKNPKISTGALLRDEVKFQTSLGKKLKMIMDKGEFIDDQIVLKLLMEKISKKSCKVGFILDGFPRNIAQAEALEELLRNIKKSFKFIVIDVATSDQEVIDRITNRYYCAKCKTNYNKLYKKPINKNICDICGAEDKFAVRQDDTEKVVKHRLVEYHKKTAPVISYYNKQGVLFSVDGNKNIDEVTREIDSKLKKILTC